MFEMCVHTCRVVPSPNTLCARHAHVSGGMISRQKSQTRSLRVLERKAKLYNIPESLAINYMLCPMTVVLLAS